MAGRTLYAVRKHVNSGALLRRRHACGAAAAAAWLTTAAAATPAAAAVGRRRSLVRKTARARANTTAHHRLLLLHRVAREARVRGRDVRAETVGQDFAYTSQRRTVLAHVIPLFFSSLFSLTSFQLVCACVERTCARTLRTLACSSFFPSRKISTASLFPSCHLVQSLPNRSLQFSFFGAFLRISRVVSFSFLPSAPTHTPHPHKFPKINESRSGSRRFFFHCASQTISTFFRSRERTLVPGP